MDTLSVLYSMNGLIIGTAFLPQIIRLLKDRSGAVSNSICTWLIFTVVSTISMMYGIYKLHDMLFIFCTGVGLVGNSTIVILSTYRRFQTPAPVPATDSAKIIPLRRIA